MSAIPGFHFWSEYGEAFCSFDFITEAHVGPGFSGAFSFAKYQWSMVKFTIVVSTLAQKTLFLLDGSNIMRIFETQNR